MVTRASGLDKMAASFVDDKDEPKKALATTPEPRQGARKAKGKKLHDEAVKNAGAIVDAATPEQRKNLADVGTFALIDEATGFQQVRPKGALKKMLDERDPAVVAAQAAADAEACGFCHATGHGFNECPENGSAEQPVSTFDSEASEAPGAVSGPAMVISAQETPAYLAPSVLTNGKALAARAFFSDDGWLTLPPDLAFEDYRELIHRFDAFHRNMLWVAGDLQAQGEALYGQDYSQVLEVLANHGYTESTLGVAKSVAEKFPPAERNKAVSWNHHVIVMSMNKKERKRWLDRAAAENLSTRDLKREIAAANGTPEKVAPAKVAVKRDESLADAGDNDEAGEVGSAAVMPRSQPVTARNGVSEDMLVRVDAANLDFYDALEQARADFKSDGSFDYDALRGPSRAMAAALLELIEALGPTK